MAGRQIYLCSIYVKEKDESFPFFYCDHHIFKVKEVCKFEIGMKIEKLVEVENESCYRCISEKNDEILKKSRSRAEAKLRQLEHDVG